MSVKSLVQDPEYQKLEPAQRRELLAKFDPEFGNLNDDQIQQFSSKFTQPEVPNEEAQVKEIIAREQRPFLEKAAEKAMSGPKMVGDILSAGWEGAKKLDQVTPGNAVPTALETGRRIGMDLGDMPRQFVLSQAKKLASGRLPTISPVDAIGDLILGMRSRTPTKAEIAVEMASKPMEEAIQNERQQVRFEGAQPEVAEAGAKILPLVAPFLPKVARAVGNKISGPPISRGVAAAGETPPLLSDVAKASPEQALIEKNGKKYREILAPSKGEIKNIEVKAGKNLDDYYQLAAREKLPLEKTPDNKLNTGPAREQLQELKEVTQQELSDAIAARPEKSFNLTELAGEVKKKMRESFKNDADYEDALSMIDKELEAAVRNRGEFVNGVEVNEIKKGMWSKSYNAMVPNSNKVARVFGHVIKEAIEKAYKEADIKSLNAKMGDYITLENILENAHGRGVARGKLGKYVAQTIGAVAGHSLGIPVAGELGGAYLGGKVSDFMVDPARKTSKMAGQVDAMNPLLRQKLLEEAAKKERERLAK